MTDQEFTDQEWVYLGLSVQGEPQWRDAEKHTYTFKKLKGRIVGGVHLILTSPEQVRGEARWTGAYAEDAPALQVDAIRRERKLRLSRVEKNTSRTAMIDNAIADLLEIAGPLMYDQRAALADYVSSKIHAATRRKP